MSVTARCAAAARDNVTPRRRQWWEPTAAEARTHATLCSLVLWAVAAVILFAGSGYRSISGPLKGADFVHFYTLGHVKAANAAALLYDSEALYRLQTMLVPESAPERYLEIGREHV